MDLLTYTDSFISSIKTDNAYKDIRRYIKKWVDTLSYMENKFQISFLIKNFKYDEKWNWEQLSFATLL